MKDRWQSKTLGEVCEVVNGGTPKTSVADYWGGDHLWITPAEMGKRSSPYVNETERKLTDLGLGDSSARLLPALSVILSSRAPIGHLVINTAPMATNQGCKGLVPGKLIDHKFLFYYLGSIVDFLNDLGTGTTFKELSGRKLKEVLLPVPPLPQQKRIIAILDEAFEGISAAVANAEKNLDNARELFESTIVTNLFGEPVIQGWRPTSVEKLAAIGKGSIRTGPFGSQLLHGEFVDEGIAVLGIDNAVDNEFRWAKRRYITSAKYAELSRYTVKPGDVLITIMGTCGRCAVVPDDVPLAINSKHLCCITLNQKQCLPAFLHAYFLYHPVARSFLASQAKGSIMEGLNMAIIKELPVWIPDVQTQSGIISKLEMLTANVRAIQTVYEQKISKLLELKQVILQKAFAGELTAQPEKALREAAAA